MFSVGSYPGPFRGERRTDYWARRNAAFGRAVVRRGFGGADIVYAFNGAALEVFQEAKRLGLRTILEQTAAPWRWNAQLLREEIARWPGWEDRPSELDESGRLSEREEAEWTLADAIVCGSEFCRTTLVGSGVSDEKIHVVRNTFRDTQSATPRVRHRKESDGLRVLFVGALQLRKGIPYLCEAAQSLKGSPFQFRLVGDSLLSDGAQRKLARFFDIVGSVPRSKVFEHYQWADVFVFPTLSEGAANVCNEAMSAGLPILTTKQAGSEVKDRENGVIIPQRDPEAITRALKWLLGNSEARYCLGVAANRAMDATSGDRDLAHRLRLAPM